MRGKKKEKGKRFLGIRETLIFLPNLNCLFNFLLIHIFGFKIQIIFNGKI